MKTMSREVPTSWVDFQAKIQKGAKTKLSMSKDEITKIATDCGISGFETALVYMNDVGIILYSKMNEKLKNTVITNLPMMIDMLTKIITSVNPNFQDPVLKKSWNMLDRDGILDKSLLRHLWKDEIEQNSDIFDVFVEVMKMFSLVFEMQDKQGEQVLLVPCQMKVTTDSLEVKKDDKQTASVYVTPTDFLPDSVYSVLVVGLLNLMERKGRSIQSKHVKLFQNRSDFDLYDDHRVSLGAVKIERRHALKLEISRLPVFDDGGTKVTHAPLPSVCLEVINYLKEQLEMVYGTTEGVGYNLHVCCHMCPSKPTTLSSFHKLDECLSKDIIRCDDKVVTTAHFKRLYPDTTSGKQSDGEKLPVATGRTRKADNDEGSSPRMIPTDQEKGPSTSQTAQQTTTERRTRLSTDVSDTSSDSTNRSGHKFRTFLARLSKEYPASNYLWLRFLLTDILPIAILSGKDVNAMYLFNELANRGYISPTNVTILSDIVVVTGLVKAKRCIEAYKRETEYKEGKGLKAFRKNLFKGLMDVAYSEVHVLAAYYNLGPYNFDNVWDLVFLLERQKHLDNREKWTRFASCLNEQAKGKIRDAFEAQ